MDQPPSTFISKYICRGCEIRGGVLSRNGQTANGACSIRLERERLSRMNGNPYIGGQLHYAKTNRWTEEDKLKLIELAKSGINAAAIGKQINRSRNSVIGASHRLGVKIGMIKKFTVKTPAVKILPKKKYIPLVYFTSEGKAVFEPSSTAITLLHIKDGQCRWIVGEPKNMACCGKTAQRVYCDEHYRDSVVD